MGHSPPAAASSGAPHLQLVEPGTTTAAAASSVPPALHLAAMRQLLPRQAALHQTSTPHAPRCPPGARGASAADAAAAAAAAPGSQGRVQADMLQQVQRLQQQRTVLLQQLQLPQPSGAQQQQQQQQRPEQLWGRGEDSPGQLVHLHQLMQHYALNPELSASGPLEAGADRAPASELAQQQQQQQPPSEARGPGVAAAASRGQQQRTQTSGSTHAGTTTTTAVLQGAAAAAAAAAASAEAAAAQPAAAGWDGSAGSGNGSASFTCSSEPCRDSAAAAARRAAAPATTRGSSKTGSSSADAPRSQQQPPRANRALRPRRRDIRKAPQRPGRPRIRPKQEIQAMQGQVQRLLADLAALRQEKQKAEARQHQTEVLLAERERQVQELLMLKLLNPGPDPDDAGEGSHEEDQRPCQPLTFMPAALFKRPMMPSVAGPIPAPGSLPMFAPLSPVGLQRYAKVPTAFCAEAEALRRAAAQQQQPEAAAAVEAYLQARAAFLMSLQRRYTLLNPVLVFQLRAVNLETLEPAQLPQGLWHRVAAALAQHLSPEERQQIRVCHRLCQASLRAIRKEQDAVVQQIVLTTQALQEMTAPGGDSAGPAASASAPAAAADPAAAAYAAAAAAAAAIRTVTGAAASPPPPLLAQQQPSQPGPESAAEMDGPPALPPPPNDFAASKAGGREGFLRVLQLQRRLEEALQRFELLLLREHDQQVLFIWAGSKIPASRAMQVELFMQCRPFQPNYPAILAHIAEM